MRSSIYEGWRELPADVQCQDVTVTGGPAWEARRPRKAPSRPRRAAPVNVLLPLTIDWILALPPRVRPHALAAKFARIANRLGLDWRDPAACRAYLDDLLTDGRGGRRGFPHEVAKELQRLSRYYAQLHPL